MEPADLVTLVVVVGTRTLVPLTILRWPFWGGLACIAADGLDTVFQDAVGGDVLRDHYHIYDKALDIYYLSYEAYVASRWDDALARTTALVLFALRAAAVVLFLVTDIRGLYLYLGPNIFENFYLWVAGFRTIDPGYRIRSLPALAAILLFVGIPKVLQEYVMHYREAQTWHFVKEEIFRWR